MKIKKIYTVSYSLLLLSILCLSCEEKDSDLIELYDKIELFNIEKNGYPISLEEPGKLFSLNQKLWHLDEPVIISSQAELERQILDFDYSIDREVDFSKYFLIISNQNVTWELGHLDYSYKLNNDTDAKSIEIVINRTIHGYWSNYNGRNLSEIHCFLLPIELASWDISFSINEQGTSELLNIEELEGIYTGTLEIETTSEPSKDVMSNIELNIFRYDEKSSDVQCLIKMEESTVVINSVAVISFDDKDILIGNIYDIYTGTFNKSEFDLNIGVLKKESNSILLNFDSDKSGQNMSFIGNKK